MTALDAHLKQISDISERFKAQVAPIHNIQDSLQKLLSPIIDAQRSVEKLLDPIIVQQNHLNALVKSIQFPCLEIPDLSFYTKEIEQFQRSIQGFISPIFEPLNKSFLDLHPNTREALLLLGSHGWFLDLEMSLPGLWKLKMALSEGNITEAEDALVEYFEKKITQIEDSIIKRFPHREHLIRAIFKAHRRQEYELSIPLLLAQTDGICKDVVNEYLFIKHNKKPRTAIYVEQIAADSYRAAILSPLTQTLPIGATENERPEDFHSLNRHMVLHGESLDYGNKVNSLKAISLINYVAHVLESEKEDNT